MLALKSLILGEHLAEWRVVIREINLAFIYGGVINSPMLHCI